MSFVSPLPLDTSSAQTLELVLDRRVRNKSNRTCYQLLIKWSGWPPELVTWEDEDEVLRLFSRFTAWGQAVANRGGDVTVRAKAPGEGLKSRRPMKPNPQFVGLD